MLDPKWKSQLEKILSNQINLELSSFYLYLRLESLAMHSKFSLPGFSRFFRKQKKEELKHARGVQEFALIRNLDLDFNSIECGLKASDVKSPKDFLVLSLEHEKKEYENILIAYDLASKNNDFSTCVFLDAYVKEQTISINELEVMIKNIERCEGNQGIFLFDQKLQNYKK